MTIFDIMEAFYAILRIKKSKFSNPERHPLCAFFGIIENPEKRTRSLGGINVRFSGFSKISKNAHNVCFSGFDIFDLLE